MTGFTIVPPSEIEGIVGTVRHEYHHFARAVSAEEMIYLLHSAQCRDWDASFRSCAFAQAHTAGLSRSMWAGHEDKPVQVVLVNGRLTPIQSAMEIGGYR